MGSGKVLTFAKSLYDASLDWLFPPHCVGCGKFGEIWCMECRRRVQRIEEPYCDLCGSPKPASAQCPNCSHWHYNFDAARAWGSYAGGLRKAILSFKRLKNASLGREFAKEMLAVLTAQHWPVDILLPVPLAPHRLAERGYNQADLLARPLADAVGIRYADDILFRSHETVKQFALPAARRWENLLGAFQVKSPLAEGARVLLVDDIMTTGATLNAAAVALKRAGAGQVFALTLARTLLDE